MVVPVEPTAVPARAGLDPAPPALAPAAIIAAEPPAKTRKVVVLDPGHGGDEVGSANNGVVEKHSNLDFALRVEQLLLAGGVDVHLTRRTDRRAAATIPGFTPTRSDLQARLDGANAALGDVFVSIHSNGSTDPGQNGVEAWHDSSWVYAGEARRLAGLLVSHVLAELRRYGYSAQDRGRPDGRCFRQREGRCFTLFVIAGPRETSREEVMRRGGDPAMLGFGDAPSIYSRPAAMPAALVELLFTTYARDAAVLRDEAGRQAMARGVANAILVFLGLQDGT
jgi:N-acetylmuramoyl-L-alanine amidase